MINNCEVFLKIYLTQNLTLFNFCNHFRLLKNLKIILANLAAQMYVNPPKHEYNSQRIVSWSNEIIIACLNKVRICYRSESKKHLNCEKQQKLISKTIKLIPVEAMSNKYAVTDYYFEEIRLVQVGENDQKIKLLNKK